MIIHFEPLSALGIVNPGDLHQLLVAKVVARDAARLDQPFARDRDGQLVRMVLRIHERLTDRLFKAARKALARGNEGCRMAHRSIVPSRRIFRCSCMMP